MTTVELLIYIIFRGLAIGILVSAPMGPIGVLCIQRTLNKGRRSGLATGIGASLSDLFYAMLTGFGLSIVVDFIENNQAPLQIAGSLVLTCFGIYLYRQNPARKHSQKAQSEKLFHTGFRLFVPPHSLQPTDSFASYRLIRPSQLFPARNESRPLYTWIRFDYPRCFYLVAHHHIYHRQSTQPFQSAQSVAYQPGYRHHYHHHVACRSRYGFLRIFH